MLTDTRKSLNAKLQGLPFADVVWTDGLYKERFDTCAANMVPHLQNMFESKDISHVLENFKIAAGDVQGEFDGTVFGDGDFYKWMEAAVYTAAAADNKKLLNKLEEYIALIGRAQQEDGYISTKQIIGERNHTAARLGDINDFEVYNFGHLFTSACLYKRVTGRDSFLDIARKAADYLKQLYREAEEKGKVQTAVCPSHYMGLAEMYRTTGEAQYLELLKKAIELRDSVTDGLDDNQDRLPLLEHEKIIGHAVRANYLYAGVADLCLEEAHPQLEEVLHKVWKNLVTKKLYITGGCGALYNGASPYGHFFQHQLVHQAYGYEYQLPNVTAYNETCASIGGVYWAWRMFCLEKKAEYADVLERMLLNVNLAAVSMDGKRFFYENMLRRAHKLPYELIWGQERAEYILSYCCPPNLARMMSQMSEYAYAVDEDGVYTVLYGASRARITLAGADKAVAVIRQETEYPYDGKISFRFEKAAEASEDAFASLQFKLHLRIPAWVRKGSIVCRNHKTGEAAGKILLGREDRGSFRTVTVQNPECMEILVDLGMEARLTCAHPLVEENTNQVAVEKGPLVYCLEGMDAETETLDDLLIPSDVVLEEEPFMIQGRRIASLVGNFLCRQVRQEAEYDPDALYQDYGNRSYEKIKVRLIPYFAWDNRGLDEMRIWMPVTDMGEDTNLYQKLSVSVLETYPKTDAEAIHRLYLEELKDFHRKMIVLDDDPTGVQTVHDVSVYTDWTNESLTEGMRETKDLFFILTNSRSFSESETVRVHRQIAEGALHAAEKCGKKMLLISRGDSTLRGHYPLEMEVLREALEEKGQRMDGQILCPFFQEGGRYTINSVHYVQEGEWLIPAARTEFAGDKTFGYEHSHLGSYLEEKSKGRYSREDCIYITLPLLRSQAYEEITELLLQAEDFKPIMVDAIEECDVEVFGVCLLRAMKAGKEYLIRSAAAVPKVLGNISSRTLLSKEELLAESDREGYGGIVLIGSHVKKTTQQLEELKKADVPAEFLEFHVDTCFSKGGLEKETARVIAEAEAVMARGKTAVVYTSRTLLAPEGMSREEMLKLSVKISDAVTAVIAGLHQKPGFLIAKGGITSSDVGTKALRVRKAHVLGQVQPGIPVWRTGEESKFPGLSYIIFPGNVGNGDTLKRIVEQLGS